MYHVYIIKSLNYPKQIYIGFTKDIESRILEHNNGRVPHTSKFMPWEIVTFSTFRNKEKAVNFEQFLKRGSGRAFLKKHFL